MMCHLLLDKHHKIKDQQQERRGWNTDFCGNILQRVLSSVTATCICVLVRFRICNFWTIRRKSEAKAREKVSEANGITFYFVIEPKLSRHIRFVVTFDPLFIRFSSWFHTHWIEVPVTLNAISTRLCSYERTDSLYNSHLLPSTYR